MRTVGIDVSKLTLDAAVFDGERFKTKRFRHHGEGIVALQRWLEAQSARGAAVGLEATGSYSEGVASALHDAGYAVSVINPAQIHAFAQSTAGRAKTDAIDAKRIARFVALHAPPRWTPAARSVRELQALVRRLDALIDLHDQEARRLEGAHASVVPSIQAVIALLAAEHTRIQQAIRDTIDDDPDLRQRRDWLESIPGISERTSAVVLAHLHALMRCESPKQWVAYAGLDCTTRRSGTSVQARGAISKRGSARLRKALYFPALVAMKHNPVLAPFAARLKAAGKTGKVIVCAVMRKLMHLIFALFKHQRPFDPHFAVA